jgi:hypothetical protein
MADRTKVTAKNLKLRGIGSLRNDLMGGLIDADSVGAQDHLVAQRSAENAILEPAKA